MGSSSTICFLIFILIFGAVFAELPFISGHPPSNSSGGPWQGFERFMGCQKGENIVGLAGLKVYLHRLGYIPAKTNNSKFSDLFDSELESAIKMYQLNFNLNATGTLDPRTVRQIIQPRCGVADVINGTSSMNSGRPIVASIDTIPHFSLPPGAPRWPRSKRALTYIIDTSNLVINVKDMRIVISNAFARWSAVTPLTFKETDASADIKFGFFRLDHGDGAPFDGPLGVLAHSSQPTDGRCHLDSDETWVVDLTRHSSRNAIDLESVAVHEIGHLLGLGHSSVENAIMFPTITTRTKKIELDDDDIQGIQVLYGGNPNYNATSHATHENDTNGDGLRMRNGWSSLRWCSNFLICILFTFFLSL